MRRAYAVVVFLLFCGAELPLAAQIGYPGQYPPGRYPGGGGYPPGTNGPGIPMPGRGKKKSTQEKDNPLPTKDIEGMLRRLDDKLIIVETSDARLITIKRSEKTKFIKNNDPVKPSDVKPGDHLRVECTEDDEGFFYAINVNLEKAGTAAERANASQPVDVIIPVSKDGGSSDDDRPVLKRKGASANESPASDDPDRPVLRRKDPPADAAKAEAGQPATDKPGTDKPATDKPEAAKAAPAAKTPAKPQAPEPPPDQVPSLTEILNQPAPPPAPRDADDPGPPKLAHGRAPRRAAAEDPPANTQPVQVATAKPPTGPAPIAARDTDAEPTIRQERPPEANVHHDPVIEKARDKAGEFTESLPAYVCQEFMARFVNTSHTVNWQAQDVVSTEVVYDNGKESYRNIAINGKPVKKSIEQMGGAWSTGEFGTVLIDLFSPTTAADFRYRREAAASGKTALVYDFMVLQPNSHWNIISASQNYKPSYKGTVWIDKRNYRVLRIEMQAYHIPEDFPLDKVESATDYDYVRFGGVQEYLMPVHAETLSCQRGTNLCSMNKIDFRNYHKYAGESVITFGSDKPQEQKTEEPKDPKKK